MVKELTQLFNDEEGNLREKYVNGPIAQVRIVGSPIILQSSDDNTLQEICRGAPEEATAFIRGPTYVGFSIVPSNLIPVAYYRKV